MTSFLTLFHLGHDSCATVVQDSRDMDGSHAVGSTTWVSREIHSMPLVSCTTIAQQLHNCYVRDISLRLHFFTPALSRT
jgi:hypothetical protein